jgi:peptidoglycan/LPS O-acetylase OafA/YrhL
MFGVARMENTNLPHAVVAFVFCLFTGGVTNVGSQLVSILVSVVTAVVAGLLSKVITTYVQDWLKRRGDKRLGDWRGRALAAERELQRLRGDAG